MLTVCLLITVVARQFSKAFFDACLPPYIHSDKEAPSCAGSSSIFLSPSSFIAATIILASTANKNICLSGANAFVTSAVTLRLLIRFLSAYNEQKSFAELV